MRLFSVSEPMEFRLPEMPLTGLYSGIAGSTVTGAADAAAANSRLAERLKSLAEDGSCFMGGRSGWRFGHIGDSSLWTGLKGPATDGR